MEISAGPVAPPNQACGTISPMTAPEQCYPCPCCGYLTLCEAVRGSYDLCPVCFWEDDSVQFDDPEYRGGANRVSLREARENYRAFGASERQFLGEVRPPTSAERP